MLLIELFEERTEEELAEGAKLVWARVGGGRVAKRYRCTAGRKKGQLVSGPAICGKAPDPRKRHRLRMTIAKKKKLMAKKRKRTLRMNPASKRVAALNKSLQRR